MTKMLEIKVPAVGESISEVTVGKYYKKEGDHVQMDEVIAEFESDKATFELSAPAAGIIKKLSALEGDTIAVGAVICLLDTQTATANNFSEKIQEKEKIVPVPITSPSPAPTKPMTTPAASTSVKTESTFDKQVSLQDADLKYRGVRVERMSTLRKTISKRLVAVKNETAMLTTFNEVDMKPILDLRAKYKDIFKEKHGVGLGFMSFFTKACCEALLAFPTTNAQLENENIVYHDYCDVSIAVSTEKGLVVPVLRNAQKMSMPEIEKSILTLAGKARDGKLTIEEMTGGTFTITNGGVFGSMLSTPIINAPQSAILGMHNIVERAVVRDGQIIIRPIMYIALSYDHRLIDGKESVGFLVKVKQTLENPERLLLEV
ncbi:MAG: dihydrolipoyllysine-residue succinyltransferase [Bacteroidetes bacterium]|nr:dihydrolipoyllysine-residue succinyltransferase [Bacteroidota bacterium]